MSQEKKLVLKCDLDDEELYQKIAGLLPLLKEFGDTKRGWPFSCMDLLESGDVAPMLDLVHTYLTDLYYFARTMEEEKAGVPEAINKLCRLADEVCEAEIRQLGEGESES